MNIVFGAKALALTIPALGAAVGGTALVTQDAQAHLMNVSGAERQEIRTERREDAKAVKAAIETNDFAAFQEISTERPGLAEITTEQFAVMVEANALKEAGDHEAARALMQEAGLELPRPFHGHRGRAALTAEEREDMKADMEAVRTALNDRDYASYLELTPDRPFLNQVTQEQFNVLADAQELREAGDFEGAIDLLQEAGLEHAGPGGKFGHRVVRGNESVQE
ncbi:hypothetical protein KBC55_01555 [Patescibacteria group bacterium]|nr:hypothetical protein [Patescibacteria group bacterium]